MKHIEHHREPLNPLPSRQVTLSTSSIFVLKSSFGRFWGVYLIVLLAIVFLPSLIFMKEIKLDAPLFVTEWLKLSIEGILIFFILEIIRHRSISSTAHQLLLNFVAINYIIPLEEVIDLLKRFREALRGGSTDPVQILTNALHKWQIVDHALSDDALTHLPSEGEVTAWLLKSRDQLVPQRCNHILRSLASIQPPTLFNEVEFEELLGRLENFLTSAQRLYGNTNLLGGSS